MPKSTTPQRLQQLIDSHESAARAVALCRAGECESLMKGSLHTEEMMHEVVNIDIGLRTERRISHVFLMGVPIILTSRADSSETRLASCAVAVKLAHTRRQRAPGSLHA